jgi:hypothetical protein
MISPQERRLHHYIIAGLVIPLLHWTPMTFFALRNSPHRAAAPSRWARLLARIYGLAF